MANALPNSGIQSEKRTDASVSMWKQLVQKQKIHEMIKGLHAEKKKLQILHNIDQDSEFTEFANNEVVRRRSTLEVQDEGEDGEGQQAQRDSVEVPQSKSKRFSSAELGSKSTRAIANASRSQLREARSAAEVLTNKKSLTDTEFEDILDLCEDKVEQKALREAFIEKKARERYLGNAGEGRIWLYNCLNSKYFVNFMLFNITVSVLGMFLLTFDAIAIRYGWGLIMLDSGIIGIFLVEAVIKIIIYKEDYFKHVWNLLDMLILIVHFTEVFGNILTRCGVLGSFTESETYVKYVEIFVKLMQSLRVLRLLRVIKFLPNLQIIVATVFQSMVSIGSIAVLMFLFMCVFTVIGRGLFADYRPSKFGNVILSFCTLFQLLTLDDWFDVLEGTAGDNSKSNETFWDKMQYPVLFLYLFLYLVIEYFVFLNLFVAVLVDNFQLTMADVEIQKQKQAKEEAQAQQKFEDMKNEMTDPALTQLEHEKHLSEMKESGLQAEDYFPVDKDSPEAQHLSEFYKNLNSLDFERFMWKRRFTIFNNVADVALNHRNPAAGDVDDMSEEEDAGRDDEGENDDGDDAPQAENRSSRSSNK